MKKLISTTLLLIFLITTTIYVSVDIRNEHIKADNIEDIALNKPVESSGSINIETEKDYNVTDGDYDTKWCAGKTDFNDRLYNWDKEGHFIIIDLLGEYDISKFAIFQASSGGKDRGIYEFNMLQYKVEVSIDKENWQVVKEENLPNQEEEVIIREFAAIKVRYFKLSSKIPDTSNDLAIRIREIEIYENDFAEIKMPEPLSSNNINSENTDRPEIENQEGINWNITKTMVVILIITIITIEIVIFIFLKKRKK